jgi:nitrite reductase/ring-hydroxylating ferredoxin subunit
VTCPAHGSTFRLDDGKVMRPPATKPVPVYDVKVEDGRVYIRPRAES